MVIDNQANPVLDLSKQKKRNKVEDSSITNLGGVSKPLGGSDYTTDDVVVGIKLVQQDQIIDLTVQNVQPDVEKRKKMESEKEKGEGKRRREKKKQNEENELEKENEQLKKEQEISKKTTFFA